MPSKRKSRELAVQLLFLWDAQGEWGADQGEAFARNLAADPMTLQRGLEMARGAWAAREGTDQWLERLAPQWPPRRQPGVDRGILRLAIWELSSTETPPKVILDEAIELAKSYSTENSPSFVNGVLDAALREKNTLTGEAKKNDQ
jgi:N utilization substance protein B